jgi:hypothetical protein
MAIRMKQRFAVLLFCFVASAVGAQEPIVIEDLSPAQLRAEIKKVQTELYRVFNAAVEDSKMRIVCHEYVPTSSNIKREACEPQFVIDRRGKNASDSQLLVDELLSPAALQQELSVEFAALTAAMNKLAAENQYFKELNEVLQMLREQQ